MSFLRHTSPKRFGCNDAAPTATQRPCSARFRFGSPIIGRLRPSELRASYDLTSLSMVLDFYVGQNDRHPFRGSPRRGKTLVNSLGFPFRFLHRQGGTSHSLISSAEGYRRTQSFAESSRRRFARLASREQGRRRLRSRDLASPHQRSNPSRRPLALALAHPLGDPSPSRSHRSWLRRCRWRRRRKSRLSCPGEDYRSHAIGLG